MKSILLTGFFGEGNLGDEAILRAISENLPNEITPIITSGSKHNFGIDIRRRGIFSIPSYLRAAYNSPITVFTGGILQDWSWEGVTFFAYRIILAAKMGSTPVLFGTGIGPLRSEKARRLVKKALSFVKIAYIRDKTSYDLYKSLLPNANVYLGTDWTWHFPIEKMDNYSKKNLCINIRQWKEQKLLQEAIKVINEYNEEKLGLAARKGDIEEIKKIMNLSEIKHFTNFYDFSNYCYGFSHGIAMRYHVALIMLRLGLQTKLICYDDKVKDLAESVGMIINKNNITDGFKKAPDNFFTRNDYLFKKMRNSFIELINSKYKI